MHPAKRARATPASAAAKPAACPAGPSRLGHKAPLPIPPCPAAARPGVAGPRFQNDNYYGFHSHLGIMPITRRDSNLNTFLHLFRRFLRDQGLPVTQQREAVAEVVFASTEQQSVEEIEQRLRQRGERIGKATIYRSLETLVKSGLVAEHDFGEGFKRYEHLFGQPPVREHLVCTECGKVSAIHNPELMRAHQDTAALHGFVPARYRLTIYGLCKDCQEAGRSLRWEGLTCPIEAL